MQQSTDLRVANGILAMKRLDEVAIERTIGGVMGVRYKESEGNVRRSHSSLMLLLCLSSSLSQHNHTVADFSELLSVGKLRGPQ